MARRMIARSRRQYRQHRVCAGLSVMKFLSPYHDLQGRHHPGHRAMALELRRPTDPRQRLAPGYIDTEMNHEFWATPSAKNWQKRIPQRRVGSELDLDAPSCCWRQCLALHDRQRVTVDGGFC